jgi:hypothetical protein
MHVSLNSILYFYAPYFQGKFNRLFTSMHETNELNENEVENEESDNNWEQSDQFPGANYDDIRRQRSHHINRNASFVTFGGGGQNHLQNQMGNDSRFGMLGGGGGGNHNGGGSSRNGGLSRGGSNIL